MSRFRTLSDMRSWCRFAANGKAASEIRKALLRSVAYGSSRGYLGILKLHLGFPETHCKGNPVPATERFPNLGITFKDAYHTFMYIPGVSAVHYNWGEAE